MPAERVAVLTDYRGSFWSSTTNVRTRTTMNVPRLLKALESEGLDAAAVPAARAFGEIGDDPCHFLYTSSEDPAASYKRFLEAVVFGLDRRGHVPIPDFAFLLAHHDKVFMEVLRGVLLSGDRGQPSVHLFGALEDFDPQEVDFPVVLKPARGAGSAGVTLATGAGEARGAARRISLSSPPRVRFLERLKSHVRRGYEPPSSHLSPFIAQEFLPGHAGDFKVLRYGRRLYVLERENRPGDFRASGSGRLGYRPWSGRNLGPLLDAAWNWAEALGSPFVSMDIAYDPGLVVNHPSLIEFQCVHFGPATIENSVGYFVGKPGAWELIEEESVLEQVFAAACADHIRQRETT